MTSTGIFRPTPSNGLSDDAELRLECARLASVFSEQGAVMANAERMYLWIKNEEAANGDRTIPQP